MAYPITAAGAWSAIISAGFSDRPPSATFSRAQFESIDAAAKAEGVTVDDLIRTIADQGDEKDRKIARLEGMLQHVETSLGEWLTDNTVAEFEEQPEIDGLRSNVTDILGGLYQ